MRLSSGPSRSASSMCSTRPGTGWMMTVTSLPKRSSSEARRSEPPTPESKMPTGAAFTSPFSPGRESAIFQHPFTVFARFLDMPRPWLWGVILGLCIGAGVVLLSSIRYGLSAPLLILGLVLAIGFGGLALVGLFVRGRPHVD